MFPSSEQLFLLSKILLDESFLERKGLCVNPNERQSPIHDSERTFELVLETSELRV